MAINFTDWYLTVQEHEWVTVADNHSYLLTYCHSAQLQLLEAQIRLKQIKWHKVQMIIINHVINY